ncbi:MAG: restriction endonuclease subunit S, partial [Candidatus Moraniibacteriota bacterium]
MKTNKPQKNIPDGWISKTLGDFLEKVEGGGTPSKENFSFWNGAIPWASVKDVVTHNPFDTQDHISKEGLQNSSSRLVSKGTLIVPTRMALGHAVFFKVDVAINQDLKALYPKKELSNKFLFYWFESKKEFIKRLGSGSTVDGIQQNELKAIKFSLPPLSEQKRIVSVLETFELVIEKLIKKIKIKKNIKKGLMQNLLTGKIRLAGFSDKWKTFEVGELLDYEQPTKYIVKSTEYSDLHKTPVLTANKSFVRGYTDEIDGIYKNVPAIIFDDFTMDNKYVDFSFKVKSSAIKILKQKNNKVNLRFVFEKMQLFNIIIGQHKRNYISEYQFLTMDMPAIKEQDAITNIIVTADKEIKSLEKKLSILKDQKKYLLNNLITGTIRTK